MFGTVIMLRIHQSNVATGKYASLFHNLKYLLYYD